MEKNLVLEAIRQTVEKKVEETTEQQTRLIRKPSS